MKKLRITVEKKVYEVLVEVLEDDEHVASGPGFGSPLPPPPVHSALPKKAAPPATAPAPAMPAGPHDPDVIMSPIAGTVQKVFVQAGGHVEGKTPVVLLDAMKMDTYIYASRTGEIAEVLVAAGDAVQVGDPLIRYTPGE
jgi:glutaconyl-CoA/methylmalonyl-CoA decarboxylase subunit gamma